MVRYLRVRKVAAHASVHQSTFLFHAGRSYSGGNRILARGLSPGSLALFGVLLVSFLTVHIIRGRVSGARFEDQTDWKQVLVGKRMPTFVKLYSNY